ncbi:MAG: SCP2 sterol-binding domain-containing protein [Actinomycetota bacterium]|nr:SCP2 sterol-binding domain-containing protein [Actinomycetota bacterium]
MATVQECEQAFHGLAAKLAGAHPDARRKASFDRSLTCTLRDLNVIFAGRLRDGELINIRQVDKSDGQVKMTMSSDDLLKLVAGDLHMGSAWASGRVKIDASVFDLLKLRSIF